MEDLLPQKPFFDRYEFTGDLAKHNEVANKIHFIVQHSKIRQGEIIGKVLGSKNTLKKLQRIADLPGPFLKLASKKHEQIKTDISSEKVLLRTIGYKSWPGGYGEEMTSIIADLRFEDLTVTEHFPLTKSQERHLTFYLAGPRRCWSVDQSRMLSFTGEAETTVLNSKIELNEDLPFDIEVRPYYFYDDARGPDNYELTTDVLVLHFKTEKSPGEFSNEDFVRLGKALADDIVLLISFLSRHWITWYRYKLAMSDCIKTYIRTARQCTTKELNWEDCLIEPYRSKEFLKIGISNFRKLRKEGFDLFMPIVYFVSGSEAKYLEEKFSTLFLSLERIKDMFARKEDILNNVPDEEFKRLKSFISDLIQNNVQSSEVFRRIKAKIPELNRPSLRFVLDSLFSRYDVDWRDLYPRGSSFTLINTRNDLFHSSKELNLDLLVKELERLRVIIERLLIRMLGWVDLSRSPIEYIKTWLTTPDINSNET